MKVKEIVARIIEACDVESLTQTRDQLIEGDWEAEITGIVTTFMAAVCPSLSPCVVFPVNKYLSENSSWVWKPNLHRAGFYIVPARVYLPVGFLDRF